MIQEAGWRDSADAQHYGIGLVWETLFPHEAQLERLTQGINDLAALNKKMIDGGIWTTLPASSNRARLDADPFLIEVPE